jgi:hypothetical protein
MNQCLVEPVIKNIAMFLAAVMNPMHTALFCSIDPTPKTSILVVWTRPLIHARQKAERIHWHTEALAFLE